MIADGLGQGSVLPLLRSSLVNRHKMPKGQVMENKRPYGLSEILHTL